MENSLSQHHAGLCPPHLLTSLTPGPGSSRREKIKVLLNGRAWADSSLHVLWEPANLSSPKVASTPAISQPPLWEPVASSFLHPTQARLLLASAQLVLLRLCPFIFTFTGERTTLPSQGLLPRALGSLGPLFSDVEFTDFPGPLLLVVYFEAVSSLCCVCLCLH